MQRTILGTLLTGEFFSATSKIVHEETVVESFCMVSCAWVLWIVDTKFFFDRNFVLRINSMISIRKCWSLLSNVTRMMFTSVTKANK